MEKETTLAQSVTISGVGLHTGIDVTLVLKPAPEKHGFVFLRVDLPEKPVIPALAKYVTLTNRSTTLEKNGVKIQTVEHLLASLVALDIDNVLIEINTEELPIMDGSAYYFVEALKKAGKIEQNAYREYFEPKQPFTYKDPVSGSELTIIPNDTYSVLTVIDFDANIVGTQNAYLEKIEDFEVDIAKARTFCFLNELEQLLDAGLIKGGDLNNAIIYVDTLLSDNILSKLELFFGKKKLTITPNGILNNLELHFSNEAARHKLLDIIGDLALIGKKIKGRIIANKPGHAINTHFAKLLQKTFLSTEFDKIPPYYDINKPPVMDIIKIQEMLPHRPPFLLVDKIIELTPKYIVGVKNISMNEPYFLGHFPGEPIMPGVLQLEALAQAGGIFVLSKIALEGEKYMTYFMKIDNARFKHKVVPGDILLLYLKLLSPIRRGICHMQAYSFVGNKMVSEAELTAKIVKISN